MIGNKSLFSRSATRPPRMSVMVGVTEISGLASALSSGISGILGNCSLVLSSPHPFQYDSDCTEYIPRVWKEIGRLFLRYRHILILKVPFWLMWKLWSWIVLIWALVKFDCYIYVFGRTITETRIEDIVYGILKKRIVLLYCGSDSRPSYIDGPEVYKLDNGLPSILFGTSFQISKRMQRRDRLGFKSVNSPMTGQFHCAPYVNLFSLGVPRIYPDSKATPESDHAERLSVRILHAPSHIEVKGTLIIRDIILRLRAKGYLIEYVELHNVSNSEVLSALQHCDFVIDQIYSDTPMAAFALEAAMFGKAAIVGGYASGLFNDGMIASQLPPSLFVHPDMVELGIERLITDRVYRQEIGRRAHHFVTTTWSLQAVAARYLQLFTEQIPEEWFVQPGFVYVNGGGLPEVRAQTMVAALLEACGPGGLCLDHSPPLRRAFVKFAARGPIPSDSDIPQ